MKSAKMGVRKKEPKMFTYRGSTAMITGASKGLGAAFAKELAGRGMNLVLVARSIDTLQDLAEELASIQVNVQALVGLSHALGAKMVSRGSGGIINLASNSAFQPLPYMATYAASKAFVLHFGEALQHELSPTGVRVMTACPGPTATSFFDGTSTTMSDRSFDTPEIVVRGILRAFDQGKAVVYPG